MNEQFEVMVLESLPEQEPQTGERLFNEVLLVIAANSIAKPTFNPIFNRLDLQGYLECLLGRVQGRLLTPILHLEAHGSEEGLHLVSGEVVPWHEFDELLRPINFESRMRLIVNSSACYGIHMMECLNIMETSPVFGSVGPPAEVGHQTLFEFNREFYNLIFEGEDLSGATRRGNRISGAMFRFDDASQFAAAAIDRYCAMLVCESDNEKLGLESFSRKLREIAPRNNGPTAGELRQVAKNVAPNLLMQRRKFFLMLDHFPENEARFSLPSTIVAR
jgi:hypothetical protein